jgi:hypothetical protein
MLGVEEGVVFIGVAFRALPVSHSLAFSTTQLLAEGAVLWSSPRILMMYGVLGGIPE